MRVCYFGTYERDYPRNALLIDGLRQAGITVYECHAPVWERQRDKSGVYRGLGALLMLARLLLAYSGLALRYLRTPKHELVIVGYVGQFDMPLAWLLTRLRAVPLVFNPLVSLYDTFCDDRGLVRPGSLKGRAFRLLDAFACRAADMVLLDTAQHRDYFAHTFRVPPDKLRVLPVGADERVFAPGSMPPEPRSDICELLFVGKLIPLHGCETILRAAAILREQPIRFTIIGSGQEQALVRRMVAELGLTQVTLIDWVEYDELPRYYARADICLGIFGASAKAARVIPNKVFQGLAMGRPVLSADTPALRGEFAVGDEIAACAPADPAALAAAIARLAADSALRERLACQGLRAFQTRYSSRALAAQLCTHLSELIPGFAPGDQMNWGAQPEFYGPRHRFREDYLLSAIRRHTRGPAVLDAACGAGTLARRLASAGYQVLGLDLSSDFLRYLRTQPDAAPLTLLQGDITRLPCGTNQLDGVVAGEVLEHLENDAAALREIWRVLRPGGICVISVPAEPQQWDWHDDWAGHVQRYRRDTLRSGLENAGFDVVELHHFGFPFVRAFHQYVYLPRYRRKLRQYQGRLNQLSTQGWMQQAAVWGLLAIFQFDRLFNRLPLGIGLIAVARKPLSARVRHDAGAAYPVAETLPRR